MKSPPPHKMASNPNWEFMSKFTRSFLRSLLRINKNPPEENLMIERCERVKTAAEKSLASAAGPRRAWSRALLFKIRNRARRHKWRRRRRRPRRISLRRVGEKRDESKGGSSDEAEKLRKLVPGGEAMDLCSLLEEAAHYVMCLNSQVQVMRCIADFCSTT